MNLFEINAELREDIGKGASRRLRRVADKIPAVIYGGGEDPQSLTLEHNEVIQHLEHEAFYSHILNINLSGKTVKAILKDVQRHPFKPKVLHMDFQRVSNKDKIHMNVPVHFINEDKSKGFKAGGTIQHHVTALEINCLAKDLPEFIEVDVADLDVNGVIHLSDIALPKGVELVDLLHGEDHDHAVVSIHRRGGAEDTADAEEGAEE